MWGLGASHAIGKILGGENWTLGGGDRITIYHLKHCLCKWTELHNIIRGGDMCSYQKVGGGETLPHLLATSPGLPLLFLEYIMQKGEKNEENLNAWDRSFEELDMPHTQIAVVNINHTAQTHTHNNNILYLWLATPPPPPCLHP